jgi:CPA2 family monovalent cation:H+ antiporter-2/glutathione-regulated potassium-efflux system protein KefB
MLQTLVALLAAITIAVPLSRRLGLGSILGYLVAGIVIGPAGFRFITDVDQIADVAALGVIMLLFLIGLELRPRRLWVLRNAIFGLGLAQMVPSALVLAGLAYWLADMPWPGAITLGAGLALSSTAIVLPMLREREILSAVSGRDAFAVLLFQDMIFVPLVALVPLLADGHIPIPTHVAQVPWEIVARDVGAIVVILIGGTFLVRPLFRLVGGAKTPEVFTATALLLVVGTAALATWAGLSASLGAFMAGVLVSDSEYRHEIQADIQPFEGLLLGFFFISVGMSANLALAYHNAALVAVSLAVLLAAKIGVAFAVEWLKRRNAKTALRFSLALPEGSEFSFVLFAAAVSSGALDQEASDIATVVIALSMVVMPVMFAGSERFLAPRLGDRPRPPDAIDEPPAPVIICGFGRVGQVVGRVLHMQRIAFTALEKDVGQVDVVRRFGTKVYLGNPAREEVLRAAGAETAEVLVVALDDMNETIQTVETAQRHFPNLTILARARNRWHVHKLMEYKIDGIVRETFDSSLRLTDLVLRALGVPEARASRAIELFREHDESNLIATQSISGDEQRLIQDRQQATQELLELFEADEEARASQVGEEAAADPTG